MKTKIENGKIYVQSDYNRDYIARARGLQGTSGTTDSKVRCTKETLSR